MAEQLLKTRLPNRMVESSPPERGIPTLPRLIPSAFKSEDF